MTWKDGKLTLGLSLRVPEWLVSKRLRDRASITGQAHKSWSDRIRFLTVTLSVFKKT